MESAFPSSVGVVVDGEEALAAAAEGDAVVVRSLVLDAFSAASCTEPSHVLDLGVAMLATPAGTVAAQTTGTLELRTYGLQAERDDHALVDVLRT